MFPAALIGTAEALLESYRQKGLHLATAESCTGGLIAALLTEIAGSSDVVERAFVTYSNEAKEEMLGVSQSLLNSFGAVSAEVAEAMAKGALERSHAEITLAVTGIAGPGGATPKKPVGLVFLSIARRGGKVRSEQHLFKGNRTAVRLASVERAVAILAQAADQDLP